MSVDTYLEGKRTDDYRQVRQGGVTVLLSPRLMGFANVVTLDVKPKLFRGHKLAAYVEHEHTAACRH